MSSQNSFEQQLDEIVYDIFRSEEFINYITTLANSSIDDYYVVDDEVDYYYPEDLSWPTITQTRHEEEDILLTVSKYDTTSTVKECSICLVDFEVDDDVVNLECKHIFHEKCIEEWVDRKKDCPNCREKIKS